MIAVPRKTSKGHVLLPWQELWRRDESDLKIWEKSRRIGATFTEANDVAMTRLTETRTCDYWFSSADESAAYEFADYCRFWSKMAGGIVDSFTDDIEDTKTGKSATAFCVRFPCGARMTAMTSNPRRFRSKGGDVGLDEFAYHDEPGRMYEAAEPCTMWGGKLRILSTHNGEDCEFNKFVKMGHRRAAGQAKADDIPFSIHRITIVRAVEQGLVERINETRGTNFTREGFLKARRKRCRNEDQWNQEYMAVPASDSSAWLPYDFIERCQHPDAGDPSRIGDGPLYVGADIGEVNDPTTVWLLERVGDVLWTRQVLKFTDEPLSVKEEAILNVVRRPRVVRACIDATGVGAQIAQAVERTGKGEGVKFTLGSKDEIASPMRGLFEDSLIRIPDDPDIRRDLHSVRMTLAAGHPRFDAARSTDGHGDHFWGLGLARHAAGAATPQPYISVG